MEARIIVVHAPEAGALLEAPWWRFVVHGFEFTRPLGAAESPISVMGELAGSLGRSRRQTPSEAREGPLSLSVVTSCILAFADGQNAFAPGRRIC